MDNVDGASPEGTSNRHCRSWVHAACGWVNDWVSLKVDVDCSTSVDSRADSRAGGNVIRPQLVEAQVVVSIKRAELVLEAGGVASGSMHRRGLIGEVRVCEETGRVVGRWHI